MYIYIYIKIYIYLYMHTCFIYIYIILHVHTHTLYRFLLLYHFAFGFLVKYILQIANTGFAVYNPIFEHMWKHTWWKEPLFLVHVVISCYQWTSRLTTWKKHRCFSTFEPNKSWSHFWQIYVQKIYIPYEQCSRPLWVDYTGVVLPITFGSFTQWESPRYSHLWIYSHSICTIWVKDHGIHISHCIHVWYSRALGIPMIFPVWWNIPIVLSIGIS